MLRDHWTQGLKELSQPPVPAEILKNFSNVASDVLCDLRAFSYDPENANRAQRFTVQELAECIYDYTAKRVASMGVLMFVADDTSQLPARRRATEKPADKIDPKCVPEAVASGFTASALELILKNRDARMPFLAAVGRAFVETCFTHRHPHVRRLVLHNFAEDASSGRRLLQVLERDPETGTTYERKEEVTEHGEADLAIFKILKRPTLVAAGPSLIITNDFDFVPLLLLHGAENVTLELTRAQHEGGTQGTAARNAGGTKPAPLVFQAEALRARIPGGLTPLQFVIGGVLFFGASKDYCATSAILKLSSQERWKALRWAGSPLRSIAEATGIAAPAAVQELIWNLHPRASELLKPEEGLAEVVEAAWWVLRYWHDLEHPGDNLRGPAAAAAAAIAGGANSSQAQGACPPQRLHNKGMKNRRLQAAPRVRSDDSEGGGAQGSRDPQPPQRRADTASAGGASSSSSAAGAGWAGAAPLRGTAGCGMDTPPAGGDAARPQTAGYATTPMTSGTQGDRRQAPGASASLRQAQNASAGVTATAGAAGSSKTAPLMQKRKAEEAAVVLPLPEESLHAVARSKWIKTRQERAGEGADAIAPAAPVGREHEEADNHECPFESP